ncbi:MAG: hypothetical protein SGILL_002141 [Bacillariaceae sp.]
MAITHKAQLSLLLLALAQVTHATDKTCPNDSGQDCGGDNGSFLTCLSQSDDNPSGSFLTGYCSSTENAGCNYKKQFTTVNCDAFSTVLETVDKSPIATEQASNITTTNNPQFSSNAVSMIAGSQFGPGFSGLNGWICSDSGVDLVCPQGEAIIGTCGVGKSAYCTEFCMSASRSGILCGKPPSNTAFGIVTPSDTTSALWEGPFDGGIYAECQANTVACGLCQSGENHDCQGRAWNMLCCEVAEIAAIGQWIALNQNSGTGTSYTITQGLTDTTSQDTVTSMTKNTGGGVFASVSDAMPIPGSGSASGDYGQSYTTTNEATQTWSHSETSTYEIDITSNGQNSQVWQWVYNMEAGSALKWNSRSGNLALTSGPHEEPLCYPGYAINGTYTDCMHGGWIGPEPTKAPTTHSPTVSPTSPEPTASPTVMETTDFPVSNVPSDSPTVIETTAPSGPANNIPSRAPTDANSPTDNDQNDVTVTGDINVNVIFVVDDEDGLEFKKLNKELGESLSEQLENELKGLHKQSSQKDDRSEFPSESPTMASDRPTGSYGSEAPSASPTAIEDSEAPSMSPSVVEDSSAPSATPTESTTDSPSSAPSASPSSAPSSSPSPSPSAAPSSSPSSAPSETNSPADDSERRGRNLRRRRA